MARAPLLRLGLVAFAAGLGLGLGLAGGCKEAPPGPPLEVVVAGCTSWAPDGSCEHTPGTELRVWTEGLGPLEVRADDDTLTVTTTAADTGRRLTFVLPDEARALEVRAGSSKARLTLTPVATSTPTDPVRRRARALFDGGRSALRAGKLDLAVSRLTASASVARSRGDEACARDADLLAAFVEVVLQGHVRRATQRIARLGRPPMVDGRSLVLDHYHRGLVAGRTTDTRLALEHLEVSFRWASRVGSAQQVTVAHERARVLMDSGRARDAAKAFDAMLPLVDATRPCVEAAVAVSAGWARVVAQPSFELGRARELFERAESLYVAECPQPADANNVRVNLAFLDASDDPLAARRHLARVVGPEQPESRLWRTALLARLDLEEGSLGAAEAAYRELREQARAIRQVPLEWQAEVGLGRVARRRGPLAAAILRFEAAEAVLDRQTELVPINRGRRFLLEDRSESLGLLVSAYLSAGRPEVALNAVRRGRRRTARSVAARDILNVISPEARVAWSEALERYERSRAEARQLAERAWAAPRSEITRIAAAREQAEARVQRALDKLLTSVAPEGWFDRGRAAPLPRPASDTLLVVPFATGGVQHVFFSRGGRTEVAGLAEALDGETWERLLHRRLDGVARIRILADPGGIAAGLEAAMLSGMPIAAALPVAYSLDLEATKPKSAPTGALVVFDPRGDLADARLEGEEVAKSLSRMSASVTRLGPLEATPDAVRAALSGRRLFHFAGHAEHRGPQGWQSALLLSNGLLDMGDLLTLHEPPRWVVLSGCETARTRVGQVSAGLGLSQVLLAAGSEVVIATRAPVDSRVARTFSRALYSALQDRDDVEAAFTGAVRALHHKGQRWQDFLLLVRHI